jgi:ribulose-phosphate 3-epimerase
VVKAKIKLAPSILSADFSRLGEQVDEVSRAGADYIHVDVMDGQFVPQITIGAVVVESIRRWTKVPLDVHLMIKHPERQIDRFIAAGADIVVVHVEACTHVHRVIQQIKEKDVKAGIALNPGTPIEAIRELLPLLDLVLVMTVNPGFAGQPFIPETLDKIARMRAELDEKGSSAELEADGGINADNALAVYRAGARVLVAGQAIFGSEDGVAAAMQKIRSRLL